jgi:hypothetical protein
MKWRARCFACTYLYVVCIMSRTNATEARKKGRVEKLPLRPLRLLLPGLVAEYATPSITAGAERPTVQSVGQSPLA